ncbi:MAG: twin-arginine translocase TatA/TatE family subunit [Prolixibacteraceae bacterium]|jgi:sec-independent protein translocase protein TatA|nr:twin-arginine translocase TatA/TatE family subunit [Prolixibacteraceae bacterium]
MYTLFISGQEILLVVALVLLLFGAKAIPDIARTLGKGVNEFRKASEDIKREFNDSTSDIKKNINEVSDTVKKESGKIKKDIEESTKTDD